MNFAPFLVDFVYRKGEKESTDRQFTGEITV